MTDRQTQIDPWATVELVHICHGYDAFYYEVDAVDAARAADAAQIASLTTEVQELLEDAKTIREAAQAILGLGRIDLSKPEHNAVWRDLLAALDAGTK